MQDCPDGVAYLDANATVPACPEAVEAVVSAMASGWGNPSSAHQVGSRARFLLEDARDAVAAAVGGASPEWVSFNSGGTEGNNMVLSGMASAGWHVVTTAAEHPSVLKRAVAAGATLVPVSRDGVASPSDVAAAVAASGGRGCCVSIQWANGETGALQPMAEIVAAVRLARPDAFIHSDAAQAIGRVPVAVGPGYPDALTFSAHKLHGPQGVGALVMDDARDDVLPAMIRGGGQEGGRRSGTQNVAGAAGLAAALRARTGAFDRDVRRMRLLRDTFEDAVLARCPGVSVVAGRTERLPNTSCLMFAGRESMWLMARLDAADVCCSVGSACSAARPAPSPALLAMGYTEAEAFSVLRFSFSIMNTVEEAMRAADAAVNACT